MDPIESRRQFLKFVSGQTVAIGLSPLVTTPFLTGCTTSPHYQVLRGLEPSFIDQLRLVSGLSYKVLVRSGDKINKQGETFGYNNDFTCFLPFENQSDEGLLWVNHESVIPQFIHNKNTNELKRSINEVIKEQEAVGGSILHIKKTEGEWKRQTQSQYNRRLHGRSKIPFSHGKTIQGSQAAVGTLANCAGGLTPWRTFLTSEENYDDFYGEAQLVDGQRKLTTKDKFNWWKHFPLPPEHYGWIVEVDPMTGEAEKQILLGRAPHEGATVTSTRDGKAVVYMGEDREGGFLFKFVSDGMNLKAGTLYAANTNDGRWIPLDIEKTPVLKKHFQSQLEVLTYAHQAAQWAGATPQDRPEDIEVHPKTGDVFVAMTKNGQTGNLYGGLLKISENKDHDAVTFKASTWLSGGLETGLACPDNLCFDKKGNLWVTTDMSEKVIGKGPYKMFGNNGLFYIPTTGPGAGQPVLVATAPVDAELTGPWFSPDQKTLFLSVQHPGSSGRNNLAHPTSRWPDGPGTQPKPSVVAIQGPLFEQLLG